MQTRLQIQFRLNGLIKRKQDRERQIEALTNELPVLDAKIEELQIELENTPEDVIMPTL
jgi:hypothetical protein